ncbi:MAG: LPS export ABC transporter periplasmic protein LptC [Fimbriimonadaceae bacterium]|nr:LPS export ABC transporter periplasmic protein LptC [Fimbriimonadaceae bacterium]
MPRLRAWYWLPLCLLLGGCGKAPEPTEARPPERQVHVAVAAPQTTLTLQEPGGEPVFELRGRLRSAIQGQAARLEVLDAAARSLQAGYRATARAGRIRYLLGEQTVAFDRTVWIDAPERHADLETAQASYHFQKQQFSIPGLARVRFREYVLTAAQATAALDLRTVRCLQVTASGRGDGPQWSARAAGARVDGPQTLTLTRVTGELRQRDGVATFEAPRAVWSRQAAELRLDQGAVLRRGNLTVRATALTWRPADELVRTSGPTTLTQPGLTARGAAMQVDLATRRAVIRDLSASTADGQFTAASATIDATRTITARELRGTLRDGVTCRAPQAVYAADSGLLRLPAGGSAQQGGASVQAGQLTWQRGGQLTASGEVHLTDRGSEVRGSRLTAPADLSQATLSPVSAAGSGPRRWRLQASSGTWRRGGLVSLRAPSGRLWYEDQDITASADRASFQPATAVVTLESTVRASRAADGLRLRADRATWDAARGVLRATGDVQAEVRGMAVRNRSWTYYLGSQRPPAARQKESAGASANRPRVTGPGAPAAAGQPAAAASQAGPAGGDGATGQSDRPGAGGGPGPQTPGPAAEGDRPPERAVGDGG